MVEESPDSAGQYPVDNEVIGGPVEIQQTDESLGLGDIQIELKQH